MRVSIPSALLGGLASWRLIHWQEDGEPGTCAGRGIDFDQTVVIGNDAMHNGKSQAGAFAGCIKRLEDMIQMFGRNSLTVIGYNKANPFHLFFAVEVRNTIHREDDTSCISSVLLSIDQEICKHLHHTSAIHLNFRNARRGIDFQFHSMPLVAGLEAIDRIVNHIRGICLFQLRSGGTRELQQVIHQRRYAP